MTYRILAIIPARSGSQRLRHKNIRKIQGIPLLVRAIRLALASQKDGEQWEVLVSTDSPHYANIARQAGASVPFIRPKELAGSQTRMIDVVLHALAHLGNKPPLFHAVLMLSPATPLTLASDVRRCIDTFKKTPFFSVASVVPDPYSPSWRFQVENGRLDRNRQENIVKRSQETPAGWVLNGALYMSTPAWLQEHRQFVVLGRTKPLYMPRSRSLDIDTSDDLRVAAALLQSKTIRR
jgi:CMP-N,N'-diacetyllegionaminic acid synthase